MAGAQDEELCRALEQEHPQVDLNALCALCEVIVSRSKHFQGLASPREVEDFEHYQNLKHLQTSAEKACHFCSLLFASAKRFPENVGYFTGSGKIKISFGPRIHSSAANDSLEDILFSVSIVQSAPSAELYIASGASIYQESDYPESNQKIIPRSWSTASDDTFSLVKFWLDDCMSSHVDCKKPSTVSLVPTRLVQICNDPVRLRLVLTADAASDLQYTTLSYKWGERKDGSTLLTGQRLGDFMNRIDLLALPPTLRDAVIITQKLGFRYIWIDRLCIDQESLLDFETESAKMGAYYQHAALNIAALDSNSTEDSCFSTRNPLSLRPCEIKVLDGRSIYLNSYSNRELDTPWLREGHNARPLMTRAWVVQEKLLSPRTIYYGQDGLYWECRMRSACENLPKASRKDEHPFFPSETSIGASRQQSGLSKETVSRKAVFYDFLHSLDTKTATINFNHAWSNLVFQYTSCAMTNKGDRLVAIAGIVDVISQQTGRKATYGMWHDLLATELAWRRGDGVRIGDESLGNGYVERLEGIAPSWSWGSIAGAIKVSLDGDMQYQYVGGPYYPTCEASLLQTAFRLSPHGNDYSTTTACRITLDLSMIKATVKERRLLAGNGMSVGDFTADAVFKDAESVWLMPLARRGPLKRSWGARVGIAVQRLERDQDLWTRVGWFRREGPVWSDPGSGSDKVSDEDRKILEMREVVLV